MAQTSRWETSMLKDMQLVANVSLKRQTSSQLQTDLLRSTRYAP